MVRFQNRSLEKKRKTIVFSIKKQLTTLSFIKFYKTPMSQLKAFSEKAFDKWTMITHLYKKIKNKN